MGYLDAILAKTAATQPLGSKYPFIPAGNHTKVQVKDLFVLVGGTKGDTAIMEVAILESDNPTAQGNVFSAVNPLQGSNKAVSYGNLQMQAQAIAASVMGEPLEAALTFEELSELGIIGVKAGPEAPKDLASVRSKAIGTIIRSNSVQVLKKDAKMPMTPENSYVRHNWAPVFAPATDKPKT